MTGSILETVVLIAWSRLILSSPPSDATIKMSPSLGSRGRPHFTDRIQKEWPQAVRSALHLRSTLHRFFYYTFPF